MTGNKKNNMKNHRIHKNVWKQSDDDNRHGSITTQPMRKKLWTGFKVKQHN